MDHLGLDVGRLIRISFGPFQLGDMETGAVEEVKRRILAEQIGSTLAEKLGLASPKGGGGTAKAAKPARNRTVPKRNTRSARPHAK
jgi:23S rRNA pseudouridine2605 synthase